MMNKTDFVAFICAVINGTSQVERKSDKLKIIVGCSKVNRSHGRGGPWDSESEGRNCFFGYDSE